MWDVITSFESAAGDFSAGVLVVGGGVLLSSGIIIALCGVRYSRAVAAVGTAAIAAAAAYRLTNAQQTTTAMAAAAGLALGGLFRRMMVTLAAAAIFFAAWIVMSGDIPSQPKVEIAAEEPVEVEERGAWVEAWVVTWEHIEGLSESFGRTLKKRKSPAIAAAGGAALAAAAGAMIFYNLGTSFVSAVAGSAMSLLGLGLLGLSKGAEPLAYAEGRITGIFVVLVCTGIAVQMIFARPKPRKITVATKDEESPEPESEQKTSWRNA